MTLKTINRPHLFHRSVGKSTFPNQWSAEIDGQDDTEVASPHQFIPSSLLPPCHIPTPPHFSRLCQTPNSDSIKIRRSFHCSTSLRPRNKKDGRSKQEVARRKWSASPVWAELYSARGNATLPPQETFSLPFNVTALANKRQARSSCCLLTCITFDCCSRESPSVDVSERCGASGGG